MAYTEESVKHVLRDRLYPGKVVEIEEYSIGKHLDYIRIGTRRGVVEQLYPHIFTVRIGNHLESFRYVQCFETGKERVRL